MRALLMIVVSLLAGLAAVVLASRWLSEQTGIATNKVAVAAVDLEIGQRLTPQQVRIMDWPAGSVPSGAFATPELLDGRVVKVGVLRDEPILETKLAPEGTKGGLSAVIGEGRRAITVRVNDVVGVAGFALPGNYVDVIVNTKDDRAADRDNEESVSKIVLEKILVLAVAQEASRDDTKPRVVNAVTLEVTPEQAEKLDLARSVGTLSLVLRNQIDASPAQTGGATKNTILGRPVAAPAAPAPAPTIRVVSGPRPTPAPRQTCVEAYVGTERQFECF
ncbi:pilus assembly protein CpaB [Quisquiliibacterium transsilvanicum]|uniref:Pilus assembly protein CpaB n=2 Tax=Quisquiliibacterium transsilvanicum TaxID=1549638 RepID=A0A7W8M8A5_9BURK|nr:pilus assembly protein CpaB [Quisquiliibacterium transsilvanicum]